MNALREEAILRHLRRVDQLSVEEAAALLGASRVTLRRDFAEMAERGLVQRVHGGVRALSASGGMIPFEARENRFSAEKAAIAQCAAGLLKAGDVVFIDGGTTTFHLHALLPNIPLRVVTNSLPLASALDQRRGRQMQPEIMLTGGVLYPESGLLVGPAVRRCLQTYQAQWAFVSVGGIDELGISNSNELVSDVERTMIEQSEKVAVLADGSKFGARSLSRVCGLDAIDLVITGERVRTLPLVKKIRAGGVKLLWAKGKC